MGMRDRVVAATGQATYQDRGRAGPGDPGFLPATTAEFDEHVAALGARRGRLSPGQSGFVGATSDEQARHAELIRQRRRDAGLHDTPIVARNEDLPWWMPDASSILDRVVRFGEGILGGLEDLERIAWDVVSAPFRDDEVEGFWATLNAARKERLASAVDNLFGPATGVGAALGGLPEPTRDFGRAVAEPVLDTLEAVYQGVLAPAYAMQQIAAGQAQQATGGLAGSPLSPMQGLAGAVWALANPGEAREAWEVANAATPGQAAMFTLANRDILDPDEVNEFVGSDMFEVGSGTLDVVYRLGGDVDVVAGRFAKLGRLRYFTRPLRRSGARRAAQIDDFFTGVGRERGVMRASWRDVDGWITERAAGLGVDRRPARGFGGMTREEFEATGETLLHGTPRTFDRFDSTQATFRGRGRRAARARGRFYFTDDPQVAERFRDAGLVTDFDVHEWLRRLGGDVDINDLDAGDLAQFRADVAERLRGRELQRLNDAGEFEPITPDDITLDDLRYETPFQAVREGGQVVETTVFGKTLDLRGTLDDVPEGARDALRRDGLIVTDPRGRARLARGFQHEQRFDATAEWMRAEGYGKARVPDAPESGGSSVIALEEMIAFGRNPVDELFPARDAARVNELAGAIRQRFFADDPHGDVKAWLLAVAPDAPSREMVMRFLMGDTSQLRRLERYATDLDARRQEVLARQAELGQLRDAPTDGRVATDARRVSQLEFEARQIAHDWSITSDVTDPWWRSAADFEIRNSVDRKRGINAQIEALEIEAEQLERIRGAFGSQQTELRRTRAGDLADRVVRSNWYQTAGGRAVRLFTEMRPHRLVDVEDRTNVSTNLRRHLRQARMAESDVDQWVGRMARAASPEERFAVWSEAENQGFLTLADEFSLTREEVADALAKAEEGRQAARAVAHNPHSRVFAGGKRDWIGFVDDDGSLVARPMPLAVSQTPNLVTAVDFHAMRAALRKLHDRGLVGAARRTAGRKPFRLGRELAETYNYYWKAAVLLRPGWTARVVLMDEQLRMFFKFGALATARQAPGSVRRLARQTVRELGWDKTRSTKVGGVAGGLAGFALAGPAGGAVGAAAGAGLLRKLSRMDELGFAGPTVRGYKFSGPFGAPRDGANIYRAMASSNRSFTDFVRRHEDDLRNRFSTDRRQWTTLTGTDPGHADAWRRAVNDQIAQDRLWRQALEGIARGDDPETTIRALADWLDTSDGFAYRRRIPWRTSDRAQVLDGGEWVGLTREQWVETLYEEAHKLVAGDPEIAEAALRRRATADMLADRVPDAALRPEVHGEALAQVQGASEVISTIDGTVARLFRVFGGLPSDELSRMPTFNLLYRQELERLVDLADGTRLSEAQLRGLERQARDFALHETRALMYDLAERSQFGEMVRLVMPFFDAYREVIVNWAGLVADEPVRAVRFAKAWRHGPEQVPGLVWTDPEDGTEYFNVQIPDWARGLTNAGPLFRSAVDSQGFVRVDREAFSVSPVFGGLEGFTGAAETVAGFGPFVQVAASELVKAKPTLEDTLDWAMPFILPYGPTPGDTPLATLAEASKPAWLRRVASNLGDDRAWQSAYMGILRTKLVQMNVGEIDRVDLDDPAARTGFLEDVKAETNALFRLRAVFNFAGPASPIFDGPFKPWADEYRRIARDIDDINERRRVDGEPPTSADALFWERYGDELFPLTTAMSRSNDGLPASTAAFRFRERHRELIEAYPELGGLMFGHAGGGEAVRFSAAMYDRQLATPVRPGAAETQRERLSPDEFIDQPDVRLGWNKYFRVNDIIEAEREERGLPNLGVAQARDLAALRRALVAQIAELHPAWQRQREAMDTGKWRRRIEGLRAIAADPGFSGRPDIAGLATYLAARDEMQRLLAAREFSTLQARANQDLRVVWDSVVTTLTERNPAFQELYLRWLEGDPMTPDTAAEVAA